MLQATYGVQDTYGYRINWNVTSSSGFGPGTGNGGGYTAFTYVEENLGQNSSVAGYVLPNAENAFRGTTPTQITVDVTPSLFENEPQKNETYTGKSSGYILSWFESLAGSQVTVDTLGSTDRVLVEIIIARAPSTIFTKRTELQTWSSFLPGVFGPPPRNLHCLCFLDQ